MRLHSSEWPHAQPLLSAETLSLPSGLSLNVTNGHFWGEEKKVKQHSWRSLSCTSAVQLLHSEPYLPPINYGACKCVNRSLTLQSRCSEDPEEHLKSDGKPLRHFSGQAASHGAGCCITLYPGWCQFCTKKATAMTQGRGMLSILLFSVKPLWEPQPLGCFLGGWYLSRLLHKHGPGPLIRQLGCIHHILSGAGV